MEIKVGDRIANVELISKEGNQIKITIDKVLFELDVVMAEHGICSIIHNGRSYNAEIKRSEENSRNYTISTFFSSFPVEIIDEQAKYQRNKKKEEDELNQNGIVSNMPGKIVKILVKEGDSVKAGQPVIIVEAMKMQNEFKVSKDSTIDAILVEEGESVEGRQTLITLK